MLPCLNCRHHLKLNNNKISCLKGSSVISGIQEEGIVNGEFNWPDEFNPKYADKCVGFYDSNIDIDNLSLEELREQFLNQIKWFQIMKDNDFEYIHPTRVKKVEQNVIDFQKIIQTIPADFENWSKEDLKSALKSLLKM